MIGIEILNFLVKLIKGDIFIRGIGGIGNKKISFGDYDFDDGIGIIIEGSNIDVKKSLIKFKGIGFFGLKINFGYGIEIVNSVLIVNKIRVRGLSLKVS